MSSNTTDEIQTKSIPTDETKNITGQYSVKIETVKTETGNIIKDATYRIRITKNGGSVKLNYTTERNKQIYSKINELIGR